MKISSRGSIPSAKMIVSFHWINEEIDTRCISFRDSENKNEASVHHTQNTLFGYRTLVCIIYHIDEAHPSAKELISPERSVEQCLNLFLENCDS